MSKTPSQITDVLRPIVSSESEQFDESQARQSLSATPDEFKAAVKEGVREGFEAYHEGEDDHSSSGSVSEATTDPSSSSGRRRLLTLVALAASAYLFRRRRRSSGTANDAVDSSQTE